MREPSGYPDRLPSHKPQHRLDERASKSTSASFLRKHECKESLATLGSLFLASTTSYEPVKDQPPDASPSLDWDSLHQALLEHIADHANEDCAFTLMLPEAGEVDVRLARSQPAGWDIALRFSPRVWDHWQRRERQCRRQLSQSFGAPVSLRIEQGSL